jgi:uncharacterized protein (TIRG00374 family)
MFRSQFFKTLLKFTFSASVIYWLASTGKLDFQSLKSLLHWQILLIGFLINAFNIVLTNERWMMFLKSQKLEMKRTIVLKLSLIGLFFNFIVPGGVGGDIVKGFYASTQNPEARLKTAVTVAMDRLIGLYSMILMALVALIAESELAFYHRELIFVFVFLAAVGVAFSIFWALVFSKRIGSLDFIEKILVRLPKGHHLQRLFHSFNAYSDLKGLFFRSVAMSFLAQSTTIFFFYSIGHFLGFEISLATYFFVVPIGFMVTAVPISPAGVGVGQAAFYYLFNLASGTVSSIGTVTITALQLFQFAFGLIGALFYISMTRHPVNKPKPLAAEVPQP